MDNLQIDKRYIKELTETAELVREALKKDIDALNNENNDIYSRYMAFCRLDSLIISVGPLMKSLKRMFHHGYTLNSESLLNEQAKKEGWGNPNLSNIDLFEQIKENEVEIKIPEELKSMLFSAIADSLRKRAKND